MKKKLAGMFANESEAIDVIEKLKLMGYLDEDISVIAKDSHRLDEIDNRSDIDVVEVDDEVMTSPIEGEPLVDPSVPVVPMAPLGNGTTMGDNSGFIVNYGLTAIPGAEPFSAAGPIASRCVGAECDGSLERIAEALVDMGIKKKDAELYKSHIDRGDFLIIVDTAEKSDLEKNAILKYYNDNNNLI